MLDQDLHRAIAAGLLNARDFEGIDPEVCTELSLTAAEEFQSSACDSDSDHTTRRDVLYSGVFKSTTFMMLECLKTMN
jgi:hypothetical protein